MENGKYEVISHGTGRYTLCLDGAIIAQGAEQELRVSIINCRTLADRPEDVYAKLKEILPQLTDPGDSREF